jgi:hypothetical protein
MASAAEVGGACARHLFAVNVAAAASRRPQLLNLAVEGLPVGGYSGIADKAFFWVSFGHMLGQT